MFCGYAFFVFGEKLFELLSGLLGFCELCFFGFNHCLGQQSPVGAVLFEQFISIGDKSVIGEFEIAACVFQPAAVLADGFYFLNGAFAVGSGSDERRAWGLRSSQSTGEDFCSAGCSAVHQNYDWDCGGEGIGGGRYFLFDSLAGADFDDGSFFEKQVGGCCGCVEKSAAVGAKV